MIKHTDPYKVSQIFSNERSIYIISQNIKENIPGGKKNGDYYLTML